LRSLAEPEPHPSTIIGGVSVAVPVAGSQHQKGQRGAGTPSSFPVFLHCGRNSFGEPAVLAASCGEGHKDGYARGRSEGEEHPHASKHGEAYTDQQRKNRGQEKHRPVPNIRPARDPEWLGCCGACVSKCIFWLLHEHE
jgi:hypothetical protein